MPDDPIEIPDFSGDDFANDKEIQKSRRDALNAIKEYDDAVGILKKELNVEESSHFDFKKFSMFRSLQATIFDTYCGSVNSKKIIVSIASYKSDYPTAKNANAGTDNYLFGCLFVSRTYPPTYIHKESIQEKIADLFLGLDLDFVHHKKFSNRFRVLTEDRDKLTELLQLKDLEGLSVFRDMEIEIRGNRLLFRHSRRPFNPKEATWFAGLAKVLATTFD